MLKIDRKKHKAQKREKKKKESQKRQRAWKEKASQGEKEKAIGKWQIALIFFVALLGASLIIFHT